MKNKSLFLVLVILCLTSVEIYSSRQELSLTHLFRATQKTEMLAVITDLPVKEINAGISMERLLV